MSKKILLIEDNNGDQLLIKERLSETELVYELTITSSGEEGVAQAALLKPDIVISDTHLPGMDGFEVCKKIKTVCGDSTKIIIMTGLIDAVDAGKARKSGADDYCVKTTDYQNLMNSIKKLFE